MNFQDKGPVCQSCGMPLAMDRSGGGTEADGSITREYCSHCFERGRFTMPDLTLGQMQERVRGRLAEVGVPPPVAAGLVDGIPDLRRWKG